jgi:hypothetical protein
MDRLSVDRLVEQVKSLLRSSDGFEELERRGLHVTPVHFYSPIPELSSLTPQCSPCLANLQVLTCGKRRKKNYLRSL